MFIYSIAKSGQNARTGRAVLQNLSDFILSLHLQLDSCKIKLMIRERICIDLGEKRKGLSDGNVTGEVERRREFYES